MRPVSETPDGEPEPESEPSGPADEVGSARFIAAERAQRLAKLDALRERGIDPYPVTYPRDHTLGEVREAAGALPPDAHTGKRVRIAGRIMRARDHGGLVFLDLHDRTGELQVLVSREQCGAEAFDDVCALDLGDWVGVEGEVVTSRTDELSVDASSVTLLSKSLRALPARLTDVDTRFRERYLDLIVNAETRRVMMVRTKAIGAVRRVLIEKGFTEVETPVLDTSAGGAAARPFITHHNALDIDMYLRIALELPLKRLIVGGMERVFEIGRVFRNEGLDTRHNPEFTLLEAYQALGDYHDMMDLVEEIVSTACLDAIGTTVIQVEGRDVDLAPPWKRITMADLIEERTGEKMHPVMDLGEARAICDRLGIEWEETWGAGRLMSEVYDETGESTLVEPTFVYDYPREVSPLARTHRDDPSLTERFECVVAGRELANAYSELNDPVDQRSRFEAEAAAKAAGDDEAEDVDEDYIRALEYALPPTGGLGIGLDRMVMLIAGAAAIRDVILFPTMRPVGDDDAHRLTAAAGTSSAIPTAQVLAAETALARAATLPPAERVGTIDHPVAGQEPAPPRPIPPIAPATKLPGHLAAQALAWLTGLGALVWLLPLIPGFTDRFGHLHREWFSRPERVTGHVVSVLAGLALLCIAPQLARRKHRAWQAAVALFALSILAHVTKSAHPIVLVYSVGMLVALVWQRAAFQARSDPRSLWSVALFLPIYFGAVLLFGFASLLIEDGRVTPDYTFGGMLETIFGGLVGLSGPYTFHGPFLSDFFPAALLALGIAGVATVVVLLFRVVTGRHGPNDEDRERARHIVHEYGSDTLAYFALRTDKSYFFGSDGKSLIAYSFVSGYALVSGDPIGPREGEERVLAEFVDFCRRRAWHVAFLAVREEDMDIYRRFGFRDVYLGDEAIIRCDTFSLAGGAMRQVRGAVTRVSRTHRFTIMREVDAPPALRDELNQIRDRWRGKAPERGFTMELGKGVEGKQPDFLLALAYERSSDKPVGFLRLVPCYGDDPGYSLDLMQRNPDSANGVTEYLIANAALALGDRGFRRLSMNFAAWGRLFDEDADLSITERAMRRIAIWLNPFFQIKSLRDFNEKFSPEWLPRSIVVEDPTRMAKVGLLYASVEGFINLPVIGRYLVPAVRSGEGRRATGDGDG
jgi:lysyl-tRNA synthetase